MFSYLLTHIAGIQALRQRVGLKPHVHDVRDPILKRREAVMAARTEAAAREAGAGDDAAAATAAASTATSSPAASSGAATAETSTSTAAGA